MKKYIGNKAFYLMVFSIVLPIMIQNGISTFVNLLDNIMVGQVGTESMSGVAIVNQLNFIFQLCTFGAISGASIFGAQFYGNGNSEYLRYTFRFKIIICTIIAIAGVSIFWIFQEPLISMYLHEDGSCTDLEATFRYAKEYLAIILVGLPPFAYTQMYASTLRETGQTRVPMFAGIAAVCINVVLNYVLIFGHFGAPILGVSGAAIATVVSRFVELTILVIWTHRHTDLYPFIIGAYRSLHIPGKLLADIIRKGCPLLVNEFLFSVGMALMSQCYSMRGLETVAAQNIASTISNLFSISYMAMGSAISIIVGQLLGAGKMEEAVDTDRKLIVFALILCGFFGVIMALIAPLFPRMYNTTDSVRALAADFIRILAVCMPLFAFTNASYFTLRSGGKTVITFLFDSCYIWVITLPVTFLLVHYTTLDITIIYFLSQAQDLIKCIIGAVLIHKRGWLNNIAAADVE